MNKGIYLIGCGSGDKKYISSAALDVIKEADIVIGAGRLIDCLSDIIACKTRPLYMTEDIVTELKVCSEDTMAAVIFSGDTGFFSGAGKLGKRLDEEGIAYEVLPGISSLQMLSAKLMEDYQDVNTISLHGRTENYEDIKHAVTAALMTGKKSFFLTGGKAHPEDIFKVLVECGLGDIQTVTGEDLFTDKERIVRGRACELTDASFSELSVVVVYAAPVYPGAGRGIPDDEFIRGNVPMTKRFVRASVVSALRLSPSDTVWDVGAGTGSVSVEIALSCPKGCVCAIEKDPEGIALIKENKRKFCCVNMDIYEGEAPAALSELPAPDAVFIGGSSGELEDILKTVYKKNAQARVVITAVTYETLNASTEIFDRLNRDYEVTQISVTETARRGRYHMLQAQNPVFIIAAV